MKLPEELTLNKIPLYASCSCFVEEGIRETKEFFFFFFGTAF